METLSQDATMYEVTLEDLLFRRIIRFVDYHEVWIAYFKIKLRDMHDFFLGCNV
jgi:hypothetical protein